MMHTLMWKEYREHRLIWLVMLAVNCGALIALWELDQTFSLGAESKLMVLGPVAALLVWGYGMVCGSMLLAGEREEGTLKFLDTLPVSRLRLWLVKGQIGLLLLVGQSVLLCGALASFRAAEQPTLVNGVDSSPPVWPYALGMLVLGMIGLAYGLFFSARGENVLHTIGLAIAGTLIAIIASAFLGFAVLFTLLFVFHLLELRLRFFAAESSQSQFQLILALTTFFGLTLAAAAGSARIFSRADRERRPVAVRRMRGRASLVASWLRIVWLCYRQMSRLAVGVLAFSLGLGVLFLLVGPLLWPVATLCLGVLCGVTVFSDEQTLGSFRFLGDQRFPLGRIWVIKIGMRFALLLLASFLILLPTLLVAVYYGMTDRHEPPLIREMPFLGLIAEVAPWPTFLLMWLLYGFCAGQLCGLLSRKSIVAAMIALMVSAMLVTVWLPSLAGIGLHFWQIAGPPLIFLGTAAFLIPAWAADRLASWKTYLGLSTTMAAALTWTVFGIWYRAVEVPVVPDPFDVAAYKASLPKEEENEAGQLIRGVWNHVQTVMVQMHDARTNKPLFPEWQKVVTDGWPEGKSDLGEWMDKVFAQEWFQSLARLPDLPLGMIANPRLLTLDDLGKGRDTAKWGHANGFSSLLAARGLQQQARGDPALFVEHLRIALALSRNLRHHAPSEGNGTLFTGLAVARNWPAAVDLWLKKLHGRPDLLKRALQTLLDHEANLPDEEESFRAMYLILQNTLVGAPQQLLHVPLFDDSKAKEKHQAELQIAVMMWMFPWEQVRHQRLFRLAFRPNDVDARKIIDWGGRTFANLGFFTRRGRFGRFPATRELADLRACQLKVALRLYQEENGGLPDSLDALVPRYLSSIPRDPFGGEPFHYHRSRGEWIAWRERREQAAQPQGMVDPPGGEVPMMPRADGAAAARAGAMPVRGMADGNAPLEGVPFMPHVDEPMRPPQLGPLPGQSPQFVRTTRFVPKGRGILRSMAFPFLGEDLIYLVPPPPP